MPQTIFHDSVNDISLIVDEYSIKFPCDFSVPKAERGGIIQQENLVDVLSKPYFVLYLTFCFNSYARFALMIIYYVYAVAKRIE